ncbi:MAG TPA: TolC family protein [Myxococcota bacterium]|nr:TolC family protein [Myxococcota bacterium]
MSVVFLALGGQQALQPDPSGKLDLTLEQAVQLALRQSPRVTGARLDVRAADARRKQSRAQFGPKFQFELRALYFSEPPGFSGGAMDPGLIGQLEQVNDLAQTQGDIVDQALAGALLGFGQGMSQLTDMFASERYDVTVTARVVQPLTPLWAIYQAYRLSELGVDAARVAEQRARIQLAFDVRRACLQVLSIESALGALDEAVETVRAHVKTARHFLDVGLIGKNDLLQAEVRLADLRGKRLETEHGLRLARAQLAMLLDVPTGTDVVIRPPPAAEKEPILPPLSKVLAEARAQRPELKELDLRIRQAEHGLKASYQGYIPNLSLLGQYQHNEGSVMVPPAWTVGAVLDFNFWEWGATYYAVEESRAHLERARTARAELERGIELDVRSAWLKIKQTAKKIEIARSAVRQAEEQLRLERQRYEAQQNTSTDVLDAQSRLTQTKVKVQTTSFEQLIARADLQRALGRLDGAN